MQLFGRINGLVAHINRAFYRVSPDGSSALLFLANRGQTLRFPHIFP
jgi:hypothetical protein